jgi:hypothetical protein
MEYSIFVDGLVAALKSYALIVALCYALRAASASPTPAGLYVGSRPAFFLLAFPSRRFRLPTCYKGLGWVGYVWRAHLALFSLFSLYPPGLLGPPSSCVV